MSSINYNINIISVSNVKSKYKIIRTDIKRLHTDSTLIKNIYTNEVSRLIIVKGIWQLEHHSTPHTVRFH